MNERAPGQTLARVIAAHGGFGVPVARARRIMGHVANALVALNEAGIVHGTLSPTSIFVVQENGGDLAKIGEHGASPGQTSALSYFAPERSGLSEAPVSWSTDVFSFAAILYEVLCGTRAFPQGGALDVARAMMGPAPSLARTAATLPVELRDRPDLVAALDAHLARALRSDPAARHSRVQELWLAVDPLLRDAVRPTAAGELRQDEPSPFEAQQNLRAQVRGLPVPPAPPSYAPVSHDKPISVPSMPAASDPHPHPAPALEWQMVGPPLANDRLHASLLVENGRSLLGVGERGLYRLVRGAWSRVPLPGALQARTIRGLSRLHSGELLLWGEPDICCILHSKGTTQHITVPATDVVLTGAYADEHGLVLVGERPARQAAAVVVYPRRVPPIVLTVEGTNRLTDVTRLINGTLVAVGMQGAVVEIDGGVSRHAPWARTGHLYGVTTGLFGSAHAVGSGGHALRIDPSPSGGPLFVRLERVQTTRDLYAVAADFHGGAVWAVGADARLMQRVGDAWVRVPLDPAVTGRLLRVHLHGERVIVVVEDGSTYEALVPLPFSAGP